MVNVYAPIFSLNYYTCEYESKVLMISLCSDIAAKCIGVLPSDVSTLQRRRPSIVNDKQKVFGIMLKTNEHSYIGVVTIKYSVI